MLICFKHNEYMIKVEHCYKPLYETTTYFHTTANCWALDIPHVTLMVLLNDYIVATTPQQPRLNRRQRSLPYVFFIFKFICLTVDAAISQMEVSLTWKLMHVQEPWLRLWDTLPMHPIFLVLFNAHAIT